MVTFSPPTQQTGVRAPAAAGRPVSRLGGVITQPTGNFLASRATNRGSRPGCGRSASQSAGWCNGNILTFKSQIGFNRNSYTHNIGPMKTHTNSPSSQNRSRWVVHIQDLTECLDRIHDADRTMRSSRSLSLVPSDWCIMKLYAKIKPGMLK